MRLAPGRGWRAHPVDIGKGEPFAPDFLRISPNNKIPAIVDPDGLGGKPIALFESGTILLNLSQQIGKLPAKDERQRWEVRPGLMFLTGGVGPMLGQAHHFRMSTAPRCSAASQPWPMPDRRYNRVEVGA